MSPAGFLDDALQGAQFNAPTNKELEKLETRFEQRLGLPAGSVYAIRVSRSGNLGKQSVQSDRGVEARVLAVVHQDNPKQSVKATTLVAKTVAVAPRLLGPGRGFDAVLVIDKEASPVELAAVVQPTGASVFARLSTEFPNAVRYDVTPQRSNPPLPAGQARLPNVVPIQPVESDAPLVLDHVSSGCCARHCLLTRGDAGRTARHGQDDPARRGANRDRRRSGRVRSGTRAARRRADHDA